MTVAELIAKLQAYRIKTCWSWFLLRIWAKHFYGNLATVQAIFHGFDFSRERVTSIPGSILSTHKM